jgi:hypothetical protein
MHGLNLPFHRSEVAEREHYRGKGTEFRACGSCACPGSGTYRIHTG